MKKKTRIKLSTAPVSKTDAQNALADLRMSEIAKQRIVTEVNKAKAAVDAHYAPQLGMIERDILANAGVVQTWAEANPDEFGKLKSITWPAGKFGFRTGTPKLALLNRKWTWKGVLDVLVQAGRWIRNQPEIDKEAILSLYSAGELLDADLSQVGMKVAQDETFFIEPDLEAVETRQTNVTPIKEAA